MNLHDTLANPPVRYAFNLNARCQSENNRTFAMGLVVPLAVEEQQPSVTSSSYVSFHN